MVLEFWKNPEFIRHRRSELRRSRAMAVGMVVLVVCVLTILACWAAEKSRRETLKNYEFAIRQPDRTVEMYVLPTIATGAAAESYRWLMQMQFGVLIFWSLLSCAQGVSRERERGTWDFQRTTRLTPAELLMGKLFGEPVLAYFIVLCCVPIAVGLGLKGRVGIADILSAYLLLFTSAVFAGLAGLLLSSLFENKNRGVVLIAALVMLGVLLASQALTDSPFPGLAAFSPLTTLLPLIQRTEPTLAPAIFGGEIRWLWMALLLYVVFGAWFVLMLLRNLKRDFQEVRLLSRWQAVGCSAFLNFVLYALFDPTRGGLNNGVDFAMFMVGMNGFVLFFLGLTMLNSLERLELGSVSSLRSLFSDQGLQWPWLLLSAVVSYLLLICGLFARARVLGFDGRILETAAIGLFVVLLFVVRDVLFIQWCHLTRFRAPLLKGVLFLALYYGSVAVLCGALNVTSESVSVAAAAVLTPALAFSLGNSLLPISGLCGIVVQLMAIAFLISAIRGRARQPKLVALGVA